MNSMTLEKMLDDVAESYAQLSSRLDELNEKFHGKYSSRDFVFSLRSCPDDIRSMLLKHHSRLQLEAQARAKLSPAELEALGVDWTTLAPCERPANPVHPGHA